MKKLEVNEHVQSNENFEVYIGYLNKCKENEEVWSTMKKSEVNGGILG